MIFHILRKNPFEQNYLKEGNELKDLIKHEFFCMKNYFCLLIKIHNDNTRKFQIISNEIENYLSINHQKYKEKINIYAEDKNPSQNQLNWFVKTFDFFSRNLTTNISQI